MYRTVDEIVTQCELFAEQFPDLVSLSTLPESTRENRQMQLLRIKTGPKAPRHGLYIQANIHAREWGTADIAMHFVEHLLAALAGGTALTFGNKTFSRDTIRTAMQRIELFVVPCVNPDGRAFSMQPGSDPDSFPNRMWRRNRRDNGAQDPACMGVDLNRNFDFIWDFRTNVHPDSLLDSPNFDDCHGWMAVSDDVCDPFDSYHGDKPFSEPEARNVRSVLDGHANIRVLVDLHGVLGKIMTPWTDDEVQTTDPGQSFDNAAHDGQRALRDTPGCGGTVQPHPDGALYREFMHAVDQARYGTYATLQRDALSQVAGTSYVTGTSFLEMYGMSGNTNDYAYSRHIAVPGTPKVDGYIYEFQLRTDVDQPFQPPFEDPPGPTDMIHIIEDVCGGLAALLVNVDRIPIVECTPATVDFGRVRVGTTRSRAITLANRGVRAFDVGTVAIVGPAGPFTVGPPSQTHLDPDEQCTVLVGVTPTAAAQASCHVAIDFAFPSETVRDVRIVPCKVRGCTTAEGACVAPTFAPAGWLTCLGRLLVFGALIIALAIPALFSAEIRCTIKQLLFRIRHCSEGNTDPCRTL